MSYRMAARIRARELRRAAHGMLDDGRVLQAHKLAWSARRLDHQNITTDGRPSEAHGHTRRVLAGEQREHNDKRLDELGRHLRTEEGRHVEEGQGPAEGVGGEEACERAGLVADRGGLALALRRGRAAGRGRIDQRPCLNAGV